MNYRSIHIFLFLAALICTQDSYGMESFKRALFGENVQEKAKRGDAEAMLQHGQQCMENGEYKNGMKWFNRYQIRTRQDSACSTDASTIAALDRNTFWSMHLGKDVADRMVENTDKIFPTQKSYDQRLAKDVAWVEKRTDSLPDPTWIARYGMGVPFMGQRVEDIFISMAECNKKRKKVLVEYKRQLQEKK